MLCPKGQWRDGQALTNTACMDTGHLLVRDLYPGCIRCLHITEGYLSIVRGMPRHAHEHAPGRPTNKPPTNTRKIHKGSAKGPRKRETRWVAHARAKSIFWQPRTPPALSPDIQALGVPSSIGTPKQLLDLGITADGDVPDSCRPALRDHRVGTWVCLARAPANIVTRRASATTTTVCNSALRLCPSPGP